MLQSQNNTARYDMMSNSAGLNNIQLLLTTCSSARVQTAAPTNL